MPENNGPADHPMSEIAERFRDATERFPDRQDLDAGVSSGTSLPDEPMDVDRPIPAGDTLNLPPLSVREDQIEAPAFLVDRNLTVRWMAPGMDSPFCQALARAKASSPDSNIFSLLLKPTVQESHPEWQALFSFVYISLRRSTSRDTFESRTDFIAPEHRPGDDHQTDAPAQSHRFQVDSRRLHPFAGSDASDTRIFCLTFAEGTLFLLRRDPWSQSTVDTGPKDHPDSAAPDYDRKETICILSARLNESHRIADTMLPDVFFRMMNLIWEQTDDAATSLGGIRAGCNGARIQYIFKATAGRNPIFSAIWCATRMNDRLQTLQARLKTEQGWVDELCVNMGISHGVIDLSAQDPDNFDEFTIPGGALEQSALLAAVAGKGEVWITKNAVSQLPKPLMEQLALGIEREGEFLRNFFSRVADLPGKHLSAPPEADMGTLSVSRILKIKKPESPET